MSTPPGPMVCYRHPDRETGILCQRCQRPICPACMTDAAVGFQCPECVKEGHRSTRQLRTGYGGLRSSDPRQTSIVLIGMNLVVWAAILLTGGNSSRVLDALALLPQSATDVGSDGLPVVVTGVADGAWWQVLTSAFTHVSVFHIGFNMLALWFLGPGLEAALGRARFLAVYLLSALTGSAAVLWFSASNSQTVGASGAIFGMLGALLVLTLRARGDVSQLLFWLGLNVVITFTASQISWQGHLGGLVGGMAVAAVIAFAPRGAQRARVQWIGMAVILGLTLVSMLLRISALG